MQDCKSAIKSLESRVDPFDLSVYSPHLSTNVKRAVIRNQASVGSGSEVFVLTFSEISIPSAKFRPLPSQQGILAVLIPNDRNGLIASIKSSLPPPPVPSATQGQQQEHNAMWTVGQR